MSHSARSRDSIIYQLKEFLKGMVPGFGGMEPMSEGMGSNSERMAPKNEAMQKMPTSGNPEI